MSDELKPCPFCGGDGHPWTEDSGDKVIACGDCGVGGPAAAWDDPDEKAVSLWNTRMTDNEVTRLYDENARLAGEFDYAIRKLARHMLGDDLGCRRQFVAAVRRDVEREAAHPVD